jgi:ubiquinone biosynthesis protein
MLDLLANLVVLGLVALAVRGVLAAREVTWTRLVVAVLGGYAVGGGVGVLLLVDITGLPDPEAVRAIEGQLEAEGFASMLFTVSLPFQVIATMAAVVLFELARPRPTDRRGLRRLRPLRAIRRRVGIVVRMGQITRIATRHGLAPALGLRRGQLPTRDPGELSRRVRSALEDAGGVFVKLGQLLATRPDLMPPEALAELGQLHAAARPMADSEVRAVIASSLQEDARGGPGADAGSPLRAVFSEFDDRPLGSASIAQAHVARLHDGREVVVKVRRPGLEDVVDRDLAILRWLARLAQRRTVWGSSYGTVGLAQDFEDTLRAELDFRNEARQGRELATTLARHPDVRAPQIVDELTTPRLLVMERLHGQPLSTAPGDRTAEQASALADQLCASQIGAMLRGDRFHGDPHPGNVMVLDEGTLGLIDFGVTGKLDAFERSAMLQMLLAIKLREPTLLYESLVAVGAIGPATSPEEIERALARWMAAHLVPGLPSADALTELLRVSAELGIRLPPQASTMFRALATLAGTLEHLSPGYPLVEKVAEQGGGQVGELLAPASLDELIQREWAQLGPILRRAPRHLDRIATMVEHGAITTRIRLFSEPEDVAVVERLANRGILSLLALGVSALAVLLLGTDTGPTIAGTAIRLVEVLGWTGLFAGLVLLLRVLLDVLRSETRER